MILDKDELKNLKQSVGRLLACDEVNRQGRDFNQYEALLRQLWGSFEQDELEILKEMITDCQIPENRGDA